MERSDRLRIGVLGAGPIAQIAHLEACRKAANAELHAICDAAEDLLDQVARIHDPARTYTSYGAMLADPDVQAVIVAVADQWHVAAARQALAAGKHVLVEKPMGVTAAECDALRREADASGLTLQVGTMRRFDPAIAFAARFVREQLGELVAVKAWYGAAARRPEGDPKRDRRRYALRAHGSHLIDTARFLAGDIATVSAQIVEKGDLLSFLVACHFANGAGGHLDLAMGLRSDWREGFEVQGEGGSVTGRTFLPWYLRASEVECFSAADRRYHRPLGEDAQFFRRQVEGFARTILDGAPQQGASAADGLAAVRVIEAIERSLATGAPAHVEG
jgi:predicted dehydrogenase